MPIKQKKAKQAQIQISRKEYSKLLSRPKMSTLQRDTRQGDIRGKGRMASNPYLATLLDPRKVTGVKVPDVSSFPTSTFQVYDRYDLTVPASGTSGLAINLYPANFFASTTWATTAFNAWQATADATTIASVYEQIRPVSAGIIMYTTSSATENSGELACALVPKLTDATANLPLHYGSFNTLAKAYGAFRAPLKSGCEFLWMPQDPMSRNFLSSAIVTTGTGFTSGSWPSICCGFEGAVPTSNIVVEVWVNYEAIPTKGTLNIVSASAPYISSKDSEEATGVIASMGNFGRAYGEDVGSWVLNQGLRVASDVTKAGLGMGASYLYNRYLGGKYQNSIMHM